MIDKALVPSLHVLTDPIINPIRVMLERSINIAEFSVIRLINVKYDSAELMTNRAIKEAL